MGLFLLLTLAGCGYRNLTASPPFNMARPIAVHFFENATFEPFLEKNLDRVLRPTLLGRGFQIAEAKNEAAILLAGTVVRFGRTVTSLSLSGQGEAFRLNVGVHYTVTDHKKIIREGEADGFADYIVPADPLDDRAAQDRAIQEAALQLSEKIADMLENQIDLFSRRN